MMCLHLRATVASPVTVGTRCYSSWGKNIKWSCYMGMTRTFRTSESVFVLSDLAVLMERCSVCTCRPAPWMIAGHSRSTGWRLQRSDHLTETESRRTGYYRSLFIGQRGLSLATLCVLHWSEWGTVSVTVDPPNAYVSVRPLLGNESASGFDLKAHLSDSSFLAVSSAKTPGAHLSMTSLWRTGSSGGGMEIHVYVMLLSVLHA